jgi:3-dehydroquinate dehydratase-2
MPLRVTIINGPNLNLLGEREPKIYGSVTLPAVEKSCRELAAEIGAELAFHQSNWEGQIIDWIHEARKSADAIIINPAGLTFTSIPILDALKTFEGPIIELHISNVFKREEIYHHSKMSPAVTSVICGLGTYGYIVALQSVARMLDALPPSMPAWQRVGPV